MGISDGFEGSDVVDCSVGTIVWVRRRNGSWWPGKILGPNELSASHLMSPRSGTPVKLLGREDASVDWYNLEKSKRVKAFRCGEFDDCIERAESSQGVPIKKREKYARREDAILHALELEKQQLEKKQQKSGISSNCMSGKVHGDLKKHAGSSSESLGNSHGNCESILSPQPPKKRESSFEDESMENTTYAQKVKQAKQLNGDDKNSEAMPRMRGLQDLGLRIAPLKRKFLSITSEGSGKPKVDNHSHVTHSSGHVMGAANHVSRTKTSFAKHKRSQRGLTEESLFRRRDRRRPLVQVLQSSAKLPVCNNLQSDCDAFPMSTPQEEQIGLTCRAKRSRCLYVPAESNDCLDLSEVPPEQMQTSISEFGMGNSCIHPGSLTEESTSSGSTKDVESDSSVTDYLDPDIDEKMALISDSSMLTAAHPVTHGHRTQVQHESMSSEELGESTINGHMSPLRPHDHTTGNAADTGVSKWQIKGKRNIRNLSRRPTEVTNGGGSSVFNHEIFHKGKGNNLSRKEMGRDFYHSKEESSYDCDGDEMIEKDCFDQMVGLGGGRHISMPKVGFENCIKFGHGPMVSDDRVWEGDELSRSSFKEYWEYPDESFDQLYVGCQHGSGIRSTLVDVDLKVQASYQGERVPLVSLMSRLDGKAIIGHPIQIEALEDCSSNILLSMNNDFCVKVASNNGSTKLPPVWRTARRTAMHRVPRPHQPSALEDEQAGTSLHYPDHESKSLYEKSHAVNFGQDSRLMRGDSSHILQPATEKKLPRKLSRKVSLSGQKTRTLSSIAIERKLSGEDDGRKVVNDGYLDGMIRPEGIGPTTVTCIPVKLVFSRLLEAVGRPPLSQTGGQGVLLNGVTQREPS